MSSICFFFALLFSSLRRSWDCRITSANRFLESSRGGFFSIPVGYTHRGVSGCSPLLLFLNKPEPS